MVTRRPNTTCVLCETPMYRRPRQLTQGKGKFCSTACRNKAHPNFGPRPGSGMKLERNPAWKGGVTFRRAKGNYVPAPMVRCLPGYESMKHHNGYVPIHRILMAQRLGRPLTRSECVNHINHDPQDNRPENLELYPSNRDHKLGEVGRFVPGVANRL